MCIFNKCSSTETHLRQDSWRRSRASSAFQSDTGQEQVCTQYLAVSYQICKKQQETQLKLICMCSCCPIRRSPDEMNELLIMMRFSKGSGDVFKIIPKF